MSQNDDMISRQTEIDAVERIGSVDTYADLEYAKDIFRKIPTAQPERKTGRWVSQKGGGYCCSECGRYALDEVDGNFIHVAFKSNFCPYYGAKMVEK